MDLVAAKQGLRRQARAARAAVMGARGPAIEAAVSAAVMASPEYRSANVVAAYLAFDDEVDLSAVLAAAAAAGSGKRLALPRTHAGPRRRLTLHAAAAAAAAQGYERHPFGLLEPPASAEEIDPLEVDLILVPGLGYDASGVRLGYGLGYYDRLLPLLRPTTPRVGVTSDELLLPAVPADSHDARMTHLVTEAGLRPVSARQE